MLKEKDFKTLFLPLITVILSGIGTYFGLTQGQLDSIKDFLSALISLIFTVINMYGVFKSHDKNKKV